MIMLLRSIIQNC